MGLLHHRRLTVFFMLSWFSSLTLADISEQSHARMADMLLREYAFKGLSSSKTGVIYDGSVPANLTGIKISALRLRSGSLRIQGVKYKEFHIPVGVDESPNVERLVLVYQNLGNWSSYFYELDGYIHLTPVLGLLAYNASDLFATSLPELDFSALENPISVKFDDPRPAPEGSLPMCVRFDLHGLLSFSKVTLGNTCLTYNQGHFSIVVASVAPAAQPGPSQHDEKKVKYSLDMTVVVSAVGGLVLVTFLSFLILCTLERDHGGKIRCMEKASEVGESLNMTSVGASKAPTASNTRTQPTLESEHVS